VILYIGHFYIDANRFKAMRKEILLISWLFFSTYSVVVDTDWGSVSKVLGKEVIYELDMTGCCFSN